jgi:microcystin-dependent protein
MRARNPIIVLGEDGKPLAGASVQTNLRPSGAPASAYAAEVGGAPAANPAITDSHGKVSQWVDHGAYTSIVSATGLTTYSEPWDAAPAAPTFGIGSHVARPVPADGPDLYFESSTGILFANSGTEYKPVGPAPGDLKLSAAAVAPEGWLKAEGQAISRLTYAALFAAIGTAFGGGDGSTTFNVPDYRERVPIGTGGALARGSIGGQATVTLTAAQSGLPAHVHDMEAINAGGAPPALLASGGKNYVRGDTAGGGANHTLMTRDDGSFSFGIGVGTVNGGAKAASLSHPNMQPYTVCVVLIKT